MQLTKAELFFQTVGSLIGKSMFLDDDFTDDDFRNVTLEKVFKIFICG